MINYKIVKDNKKFLIKELKTDKFVILANNEHEAKKWVQHLNMGGGFDGETPNFIINSINPLQRKSYLC